MRKLLSALPLVLMVLIAAGCEGCATSKPFAVGISTGIPRMENDLRHYAGNDPLRVADVDALLAAADDETDVDVAAVERAWSSVKAWYLPAIDDSPLDTDAKALRRQAADRLDRLIANEKDRPLRSP